MRKGKKSLVLMLVAAMVLTSVPVSAAPMRASSYTSSWFGNFWNNLFNWSWNNNGWNNKNWNNNSSEDKNDTVVEEPETEVSEEQEAEQELVVVEDETTVENGEMLRASTYNLMTLDESSGVETAAAYNVSTAAEESTESTNTTVLKYFNTTLYDYDEDTINAATLALEDDTTVYEGIYFSDGGTNDVPATTETTTDYSAFVEGQYYIQCIRAAENNVDSWLQAHEDEKIYATSKDDATVWTLTIENSEYYLTTDIDGTTYYMVVGTSGTNDGYTTTKTAVSLTPYSGNGEGVQISQNGYYLCQWGSSTAQDFGGYDVNNDSGNGMRFYRVDGETETLTTIISKTVVVSGYEEWNRWDKASGNSENGQKMYTGLVESTLDVNKDIVFTKPEGGIFNSDANVKSIYSGVEMPFVYENGYYTFDASENGVYVYADETQKSTATLEFSTDATGSRVAPRLYLNKGNTQSNGGSYGDGSTTVWAPFNSSTSFTEADMNYHFGMRTTIPFSMTENGRVVETNDTSAPITFSFSGDDDVWVFIDGHLVIDLGGIHNRLDATIDFQANTVTYSESNSKDWAVGSYNDSDFALEQTLFENLLPQDRTTFAATDNHELTIFYLERGKGSSNCKIEFNLPVKDTLTITKDATKSWTPPAEGETGDGTVTPLTAEEQAMVDNIDFGFTLYRSVKADETETVYETVKNTRYYLINSNGQVVATPSTDEHGHFTLKNGYSARFISTDMDEGVTYYVDEDLVSGFVEPDYNYGGKAANGFVASVTNESGEVVETKFAEGNMIPETICFGTRESNKITVKGSSEAEDSLVFICSNFLDAEMPNPSARPNDDVIVIDYGLPVEIDIFGNDLYRGESLSVENIYCVKASGDGIEPLADEGLEASIPTVVKGEYGTLEHMENGKFRYTLNKQLTGVEVFSYIVKASSGEEYEYGTANLFIVPATSMYYEENFSGFNINTEGTPIGMKYATANAKVVWKEEGTPQTDCQEPGVVGTYDDSPYGSDVAYLNDNTDSNGSSKYVDTTEGYAQFQYEFTGTGTAIMARVSKDTGYIRVIVKEILEDGTKKEVHRVFIDTMVLPIEGTEEGTGDTYGIGTLYNIPVYDNYELDYGNYLVNVSVYKKGTATAVAGGSGKDFYLDGIKVYQPMDLSEPQNPENLTEFDWTTRNVALAAYATDAESNCTVVQLRDKLIEEYTVITEENEEETVIWNTDKGFVSFTDTNGEVTEAKDYISIGPKNEIYLNDGQEITFSLADWDINAGKIYLGIKAPTGTGSVQIGNETISINNATDCYYDISDYGTLTHVTGEDGNTTNVMTFKVKAAEGTLISVTNVKVTGIPDFVIVKNEDINTEGEDVDVEGGDVDVEGEDIEA